MADWNDNHLQEREVYQTSSKVDKPNCYWCGNESDKMIYCDYFKHDVCDTCWRNSDFLERINGKVE